VVLHRRPYKNKPSGAKFFQPGEPENEAEVYASTPKQRSRRTRSTTQMTSVQPTTQFPLTTFIFTTETTTTTTTTTTTALPTTITTITFPFMTTSITTLSTEPDTTININLQARMGGQRRRNNMTLYILTSDEHKIRQFSVNHTRGILINCNQLRRRLLGRRRLRDIIQPTTTTTNHSLIIKHFSNSSIQLFHYHILLLTILSLFFLQK
jgi:hypothetical protein